MRGFDTVFRQLFFLLFIFHSDLCAYYNCFGRLLWLAGCCPASHICMLSGRRGYGLCWYSSARFDSAFRTNKSLDLRRCDLNHNRRMLFASCLTLSALIRSFRRAPHQYRRCSERAVLSSSYSKPAQYTRSGSEGRLDTWNVGCRLDCRLDNSIRIGYARIRV